MSRLERESLQLAAKHHRAGALPPFCDARVLDAPNHLGQPGTDISVFLAGRLACAPSHPERGG